MTEPPGPKSFQSLLETWEVSGELLTPPLNQVWEIKEIVRAINNPCSLMPTSRVTVNDLSFLAP